MTAARRSALRAGVVLFAALAPTAPAETIEPPAETIELWRAATDGDACRLELVNELGGVRLGAAPPAESAAAVRGAPGLAIEPATGDDPPTLAVIRTGPPAGPTADAPADVELLVPRGCEVAIRTTGGEVSLEIARKALSAAVETITGDITAWVDPAADAVISFATSGEITTDFSVEIDFRYHEEPAKHGQITPSSDSPSQTGPKQVRLTSRRGAIRMLRPDSNPRQTQAETPDDRPEPD